MLSLRLVSAAYTLSDTKTAIKDNDLMHTT